MPRKSDAEAQKRRYHEDPEFRQKVLEKGRQYYHENKSARDHAKQKWNEENREYVLWYTAKRRAIKAGVPFDIEPSDIVIPETCPMLGGPITTPSIDRVVNSLGYVKGNVCVVEKNNNRLKSNATVEQLEAILAYIRKNGNA